MSQIINISIDLNKIETAKIKTVNLKSGKVAKYVDLTIFAKDEPDTYGNNASATISQTKEERTAKTPVTYIGNGKVVFSADSVKSAPVTYNNDINPIDELPF